MSKKLFSLFATIIFFNLVASTQVKKTFAYKQVSIPGIQPRLITEEHDEKKQKTERKANYNYWFYILHKKRGEIKIAGLWIGGQKYSAKAEAVDKLPVLKINYTAASANDTLTLVPATKNEVMLIYPAALETTTEPVSKYLSDLTSVNELVIAYYWHGKKYYAVKKKITVLTPEVHS